MRISDLNKTSRSKPVLESKVKELADDLKNMDNGNFKKKYGKDKEQMKSTSSSQPAKKPVQEAHLEEDDLIIIPGQGRRLKSGFIPHGQSRLDHEVEMARSDLYSAAKNAKTIHSLIKDLSEEQGLEGWVQEKIIKANDYLNSVREYLEGKRMHEMQGGVIAAGGVGEGVAEASTLVGPSSNTESFKVKYYNPKYGQKMTSTIKGRSKEAVLNYCDGKGYDVHSIEPVEGVSESSDNLTFQQQRGKWYCFRKTLNASPIGVGDTREEAEDNYRRKTDADYGGPAERARILNVLRNADKKRMSEASPETTFNRLKGLKSWQVVIKNNYYNGKYPDYRGREYTVLATSPEEAKQVVLDNADAILQDLLSKKYQSGKKILPRGSALPVTEKHIGQVKDGSGVGGLKVTTLGFKKLFGPNGPMMVKLDGGEVVDIEGQGQDAVAEGAKVDRMARGSALPVSEKHIGQTKDGSGVGEDLVYVSVDRAEAFEDWMDSEGLSTNVPKEDYGTYVIYDFSDADHTAKMYADEWNEKRSQLDELNNPILRKMGKSRTLRKVVPGLGKHEAGERALDNKFNAGLMKTSEPTFYNGEPNPYYEKDKAEGERSARAAKKYQKIATEGAKVDRMVKHIAKSERELGKSKDEAENIAWATANKRGYLDNKNKKKGK